MKKIRTKKQKLEDYISEMIICNVPKKSEHCIKECRHGILHPEEEGRDACQKSPEFCSLGLSGIKKVVCKHLTKKDQKEWVRNELKKLKYSDD